MRLRGFEKISEEQFMKDAPHLNYEDIKLPQRATKDSAGYDFYSLSDFLLEPNKTIKIPTGIKSYIYKNEVLQMYIRSSLGFKYDVVLSNSVGIIDGDYYNNPSNEGHIWIKLINHGDKTLAINKGDAIAQGIFHEYWTIDNDVPVSDERTGGIGSTNK